MRKALIVLFAFCASAFAQAQSGLPIIGSTSNSATPTTAARLGSCSLTFATNCVITLTSGAGAGTLISVVGYSAATPVSTSVTVTNSGTANTWQADVFDSSTLFSANSAFITNAIAPSGTLTITPNAGGSDAWGFVAYQMSTGVGTSWLDALKFQTMTFGTSSSISTSTATIHQPNINILFCGSGTANTDTVSGYTALETSTGNSGVTPSRTVWGWWNRVITSGTQSATLVLTTNDNPDCELLSYKVVN